MIMQILNVFRRNFLQKLIALIAAFCMWVFVMADQDPPIPTPCRSPFPTRRMN